MVIAVVMLVVLVKTKRGGGGGEARPRCFFLSLVLLVLDGG